MKQVLIINDREYDTDSLVELHLQAGYIHVTYWDPFKRKNLTDVYTEMPTYKIRLSDDMGM